jgi:hypothetical protein
LLSANPESCNQCNFGENISRLAAHSILLYCKTITHKRYFHRYQLIAGGIEQRVFDVVFAKQPMLSTAGSFVVRTANLYLGAGMIVDWLRIVGVQQSSEEPEDVPVLQVKR